MAPIDPKIQDIVNAPEEQLRAVLKVLSTSDNETRDRIWICLSQVAALNRANPLKRKVDDESDDPVSSKRTKLVEDVHYCVRSGCNQAFLESRNHESACFFHTGESHQSLPLPLVGDTKVKPQRNLRLSKIITAGLICPKNAKTIPVSWTLRSIGESVQRPFFTPAVTGTPTRRDARTDATGLLMTCEGSLRRFRTQRGATGATVTTMRMRTMRMKTAGIAKKTRKMKSRGMSF